MTYFRPFKPDVSVAFGNDDLIFSYGNTSYSVSNEQVGSKTYHAQGEKYQCYEETFGSKLVLKKNSTGYCPLKKTKCEKKIFRKIKFDGLASTILN
jgi:hypothetical protein